MQPVQSLPIVSQPLFDPTYLNIEYVFNWIYLKGQPFFDMLINQNTWTAIFFISLLISISCIAVILFSIMRMREMQEYEKGQINYEIHHALLKSQANDRRENPRWHYIQTLVESPNDSDWRVAIIEADTMMEELLQSEGITGDSVGELLEGAKTNGYANIQNAWDAHLIRNQIAHEGSNYSLTQIEARRTIKMYQNFFEELKAI